MKEKGEKMARELVSLSPDFLDTIDSLAESEHRTRSELIREALRTYMRRTRFVNQTKADNAASKLDELLD